MAPFTDRYYDTDTYLDSLWLWHGQIITTMAFYGMYLLIHAQISMAILLNCIEVWAWIHNYIPLFYVDVITYPLPKLNAGLSNVCY